MSEKGERWTIGHSEIGTLELCPRCKCLSVTTAERVEVERLTIVRCGHCGTTLWAKGDEAKR